MFKYTVTVFNLVCAAAVTLTSCGGTTEKEKQPETKKPYEKTEVIGKYHSFQRWDDNETFLNVRPDSLVTFKVLKSLDGGMKTFVSIGKWRIVKDSIFEMKRITDGRTFQIKNEFPELAGADTTNIHALDIEATFIVHKNSLHNIEPVKGTASMQQYYVKEK